MFAVGCIILIIGVICGVLAVYPYLYYLRNIRKPLLKPTQQKNTEYPNISIVINAYKEGELVAERIRDICNTEYPLDKITLYVFNDGADSATSVSARTFAFLTICS